jgi:UrcA family protein
MNATLKSSIPATVIGAFVVSLLGVGAAAAATPDVRTETVRYQDLNLQSETGVEILFQRIHAAARRVCDQPSAAGMFSSYGIKGCVEKAEGRAVTAVNLPALSAFYQKSTGHPVAILAKGE